ncbi:MAG: hypothetical protein ACJ739_02095 [Acidimicrobiales bacterium]
MRTLQRVGAGLVALTLLMGLAACGDDDDSGEGTEATDGSGGSGDGEQAGASDEFCDGIVDFNAAVFQVDISDDTPEADIKAAGEQLGPMFQKVVDEAPDAVSDDAEDLNTTIQALKEGDASKFNSDETFETYTGIVSEAIDACDMETVDVTAVDYEYKGVPESIEAGEVAFDFKNDAEKEDHMMAIIKKKDGVDLSWEELLNLPDDEAESKTEFKGEAFASAGDSSKTLASLDAGDYAMICFISVGSPDTEDGPPHFTKGMVKEFTVE